MFARVYELIETVARTWCKLMHPAHMWPIKGYYRCPRCYRQYRVPWECDKSRAEIAPDASQLRPGFSAAIAAG